MNMSGGSLAESNSHNPGFSGRFLRYYEITCYINVVFYGHNFRRSFSCVEIFL